MGLEGISTEALEALEAYSWPGNVRELRNTIERACVLKRGQRVERADLPEPVRGKGPDFPEVELEVGMKLEDVEQRMIEQTLRSVGGNRTRAARLLGISRRTLQRKLSGSAEDTER
jgi:two-component system response regulator HydG